MKIWVKTYASLGKIDNEVDLEEGVDVVSLLKRIDISIDDVFLILVNGKKSQPETVLKNDDSVHLFPSIGGG